MDFASGCIQRLRYFCVFGNQPRLGCLRRYPWVDVVDSLARFHRNRRIPMDVTSVGQKTGLDHSGFHRGHSASCHSESGILP